MIGRVTHVIMSYPGPIVKNK